MTMLNRRLIGSVLACTLACIALPATANNDSYKFSPVNQYGVSLTAAYWNPILRYVSEKSGIKLELKLGRTSVDTTSYVLAREVDFVFSNHMFSPERESLGWKVFGRRFTAPLHGQIVVPEDSSIKSLAQLSGKDVAFPGAEATVSYKFTYAHLLASRIDAKVVFAGNADAAFAQLLSGRVAAAGLNSQLVDGYTRREGRKFRVLWSSEPVHDLALMHSPKVPVRDVKAIAAAFFAMQQDPEGRDVLEGASKLVGLTAQAHFVASDGREYDVYRDFFRSAPAQLR